MAWYRNWFDTPYYHLLYGERDEREAGLFIHNLLNVLRPDSASVFLDLACGKGRHALDLASYGFEVYGVDLSRNSIAEAGKHASEKLHFYEHDMRKPFRRAYFDYIFNLFTSFGYFDDREDNLQTLKAVRSDLKPGGIFVQDYFNADLVRACIVPFEEKERGGILFRISKEVLDNCVIKTIQFDHAGSSYSFQEKVALFSQAQFEQLYQQSGLQISHVYGDYHLQPFNPQTSPRLILISQAI